MNFFQLLYTDERHIDWLLKPLIHNSCWVFLYEFTAYSMGDVDSEEL